MNIFKYLAVVVLLAMSATVYASGTENSGAGSATEDKNSDQRDEKREERREERRAKLKKKKGQGSATEKGSTSEKSDGEESEACPGCANNQ